MAFVLWFVVFVFCVNSSLLWLPSLFVHSVLICTDMYDIYHVCCEVGFLILFREHVTKLNEAYKLKHIHSLCPQDSPYTQLLQAVSVDKSALCSV